MSYIIWSHGFGLCLVFRTYDLMTRVDALYLPSKKAMKAKKKKHVETLSETRKHRLSYSLSMLPLNSYSTRTPLFALPRQHDPISSTPHHSGWRYRVFRLASSSRNVLLG